MRRVFYGYKRPVTQLVLLMHDLELIYDPSVIRVSLSEADRRSWAGLETFLKEVAPSE